MHRQFSTSVWTDYYRICDLNIEITDLPITSPYFKAWFCKFTIAWRSLRVNCCNESCNKNRFSLPYQTRINLPCPRCSSCKWTLKHIITECNCNKGIRRYAVSKILEYLNDLEPDLPWMIKWDWDLKFDHQVGWLGGILNSTVETIFLSKLKWRKLLTFILNKTYRVYHAWIKA